MRRLEVFTGGGWSAEVERRGQGADCCGDRGKRRLGLFGSAPAWIVAATVVWLATPADVGFATKPKLATRMIARAIAGSVPFKWVAGDTVYGVGNIEQQLRRAGKGYVLGVSSAHVFRSWGKRPPVAGTAADLARTRRSSDWKRLSAGAGTKGPRLHDWCYLELADLEAEQSQQCK
ncbi:SRSO17 transposase [Bradyrhizobium sp. GM5.1]